MSVPAGSVPEGDTVWRAARTLDRALSGQTLTRTDLRVPQLATVDLTGGRVRHTGSRGKHLLTRIAHADQAWTLHTHLKMEGAWHVYLPSQRWSRPAHQARAVLGTAERIAVGFSLGVIELLPTAEEARAVGHLGPDLLGEDWDEQEALRRVQADGARPIREALLDQRNLAGLGNLYVAELCFVAGVHPDLPVGQVPDLPRLVHRARQLLRANAQRAVQATTGDLRQGQRVWVYRRERQPCRRCGTPVEVATRGDPARERATYWCPSCQPPA